MMIFSEVHKEHVEKYVKNMQHGAKLDQLLDNLMIHSNETMQMQLSQRDAASRLADASWLCQKNSLIEPIWGEVIVSRKSTEKFIGEARKSIEKITGRTSPARFQWLLKSIRLLEACNEHYACRGGCPFFFPYGARGHVLESELYSA